MLKDWLIRHLAPVVYSMSCTLSRQRKNQLLAAVDTVLLLVAIYAAFSFRFGTLFPFNRLYQYGWLILILVLIKLAFFQGLGMYRPVLRYTGLEFLLTAAKAVLLSSGTLVIIAYLFEFLQLPRSVLLNDALLSLLLVAGVRLFLGRLVYTLNSWVKNRCPERLVIYGAGAAGSQLARALVQDSHYKLVAFVDDDASLRGHLIQGLPVHSPKDLPQLLAHKPFDTILLAMPSIDRVTRQRIIQRLRPLALPVKTVPSISEILAGQVAINEIRHIDIVDLLGREEVHSDPELLCLNVTGKSVLVTGAGGSIGAELCRQIAQLSPKYLVLYELSEYSLYKIDLELAEAFPNLKRISCLGSVTDSTRFSTVLKRYAVDTVYHAAAYKHVPIVELNLAPGIINNVLGTWTAARCAMNCGVHNFVLISTDKAVRPTNVMGATKRVAELVVQALMDLPETRTCFAIVRFGNVLDSSGSVVPRFRKQIAEGRPLTVTHPDVTRYFMSIPEAARLVLQAGAMAQGGEVFLLDMGEPVRIYDLAMQMIQLSGLRPGRDRHIQFTGLRPGEKLHEELLVDSSRSQPTRHPKIFCAQEEMIPWMKLQPRLEALLEKAYLDDPEGIRAELQQLVAGYQPFDLVVAVSR